jgi:hypothetical protein
VRQRGVAHDGLVHEPEAEKLPTATPDTSSTRSWMADALGLVWTIGAAVFVLLPALRPGVSLGPFDLLSRYGLTREAGVTVHNAAQADQIQQFVPWMNLAWHQVHSGQLPLWNPYSVLGMPLAFNWQSGVFSVPALVGYLVPVAHAYTAMVLTRLVVAGVGVYVLCRALGLGPLAAAFGGTAFELSGPMVVQAAWPHTSVTCWVGWVLVAVVGLVRGRHRLRHIALLAVTVALAVYGGHPESLVAMAVAVAVFVVVYLAVRARTEGGPVVRPLRDLVVGSVGGLGLGAPLLFPGAQLALLSARRYGTGVPAFPLSNIPNIVLVGLQGKVFDTTAYVGVIVLALAIVGAGVAWRRPVIPAFVAMVVVTALLTFFSPADQLLHLVPGGGTVTWNRAVMMMALALAVLGAFGIDALTPAKRDRTAVGWMAAAFGVLAFVVLCLAAAGELRLADTIFRHRNSLIWPGVQTAVGLALAGLWWWRGGGGGAHSRKGTGPFAAWGLALLLALETGFLLSAGIPFWSVSSGYLPSNPGITALQKSVGSSLVGFGDCGLKTYVTGPTASLGLWPDINVAYGVREFEVYDPILPESYYRAYAAIGKGHIAASLSELGIFCARIKTVQQAQVFGVSYLLEPPERYGPPGSVPVGPVGTEELFSIPDAGDATTTPAPAVTASLPTDAPGTPVPVTHPDPASWRVAVDTTTASVLRLRLTNVPGWRATIDGRPVALSPWANGLMLETRVPAGSHVVELHYWPVAFSAGLGVAGVVVVGLVVAAPVGVVLRRRRHRAPT